MIPNDRAFDGKNYFEEAGKTFFRYQRIEEKGVYLLKFKFVSVNSPYKQGIAIKFSGKPEFKGKVLINGISLSKPPKKHFSYVIKEGAFPDNEFDMELHIDNGGIVFSNASNYLSDYPALVDRVSEMTGKSLDQLDNKGFASGFTAANMYGNAFWIEQLSENQYRFHCNDHKMDDDFDDLIFDIEVKKTVDGIVS